MTANALTRALACISAPAGVETPVTVSTMPGSSRDTIVWLSQNTGKAKASAFPPLSPIALIEGMALSAGNAAATAAAVSMIWIALTRGLALTCSRAATVTLVTVSV